MKEKQNINSNFFKWFGKSVVTNDDGSPKIVYHGTIRDFKNESGEDDLTFIPSIRNDIGSHFGNKDQANLLLAGGEEKNVIDPSNIDLESEYYKGSRVIPCYIRIEKPLYLEDLITWDITSMREVFMEYNILTPNLIDMMIKKYNKTYYGIQGDKERPKEFDEIQKDIKDTMIRALEKAGYDGIIYENLAEGEGESYMVFRPNQIKSIYNKGTWSIKNNRINEYMAKSREELISRNLKQMEIWKKLAELNLVNKHDMDMFRLFAKFFNDFRDGNGYDMTLEDALIILEEKDSMKEDTLLEYIHYERGRKNSKGVLAPWVIRDHETNALIGAYKTKDIAKKALRSMKFYKEELINN